MADTPFAHLLSALGMPENEVQNRIGHLIEKTGKQPNDLALEDLRLIVGEYLQDTFSELKDELS